MEKFIKVPSNFAIMKSHTFRFVRHQLVTLHARELSSPIEKKKYSTLQHDVTADVMCSEEKDVNTDELFKSTIASLNKLKPAAHETQQGYPEHNIVNRYFANDREVADNFFQDGTCRS